MTLGGFKKYLILCGYPQNGKTAGGGGIGLKSAGVLGTSGTPASVTGTTAETVLGTVSVPANAFITSGASLRVSFDFFKTGAAGTLTFRLRLGGTLVAATGALGVAQGGPYILRVVSTGPAAQYSMVAAINNSSATYVRTTSAVDMTQTQALTLTAQLTNTADAAQIDDYLVELLTQ